MLKFKSKIDTYLDFAVQNLNDTINIGGDVCENLDKQTEKINHIAKGLNMVNKRMDVVEAVIKDIENPFLRAIKKIRKKQELILSDETVEGYVLKRGRRLNIWNRRYFILNMVDNIITYKINRSDPGEAGYIDLKTSRVRLLSKNQKDFNGVRCNRNYVFEIIEDEKGFGNTICLYDEKDYKRWLSFMCAENQKENRRSDKLETIIDMLDDISVISNNINNKVDNHIDNLKKINKFTEKTDERIVNASHKVRGL